MTHSFDIKDAEKYGVSEAIVLYNIRYWVSINRANRDNLHDGRVWTYNSARALAELFPYFTADKIRRYLDNLEADGALITGNYNKRGGDRTKWYSIPGVDGEAPKDATETDENASANPPDHLANSPEQLANPPHPFGKSAAPLPDINSDINQNINTHAGGPDNPLDIKPKGIPEQLLKPLADYEQHVRAYGGIGHVMLHVSGAVAMVGVQTVKHALNQVIAKAKEPGQDLKYLPGLVALLRDSDKLIDWAERYRASSVQHEYQTHVSSPESSKALELLLAEMSA